MDDQVYEALEVKSFREIVESVFPESQIDFRYGDLMATVTHSGRAIDIMHDDERDYININFRNTQGDTSYHASERELQSGTKSFLEKLLQLGKAASDEGLGISAQGSTDQRDRVYAKGLKRIGLEPSYEEGYSYSHLYRNPKHPKFVSKAALKPRLWNTPAVGSVEEAQLAELFAEPVEEAELVEEAEPIDEMATGGTVADDLTKPTPPGGRRDKINARLQPGEVVIPKDQVAAMQSLVNAHAPRGAPTVAPPPSGTQLAGILGQQTMLEALGGDPGGSSATSMGLAPPPTSSIADALRHQRNVSDTPHPISSPDQATAIENTPVIPHDQRTTMHNGPILTPPPNLSRLLYDPEAINIGQWEHYPPMRPPSSAAHLLPGDVDSSGNVVGGTQGEDWSIPAPDSDSYRMTPPPLPGPDSPLPFPDGSASPTADGERPQSRRSRRGRFAQPSSMFSSALDRMGVTALNMAAGGLADAFGIPGALLGSGLQGAFGVGSHRDHSGLAGGLLSGHGAMADILGGSGGQGDNLNQQLLETLEELVDVIRELKDELKGKNQGFGVQPDGSFNPSFANGKDKMAPPAAGAGDDGKSTSDGLMDIVGKVVSRALAAMV